LGAVASVTVSGHGHLRNPADRGQDGQRAVTRPHTASSERCFPWCLVRAMQIVRCLALNIYPEFLIDLLAHSHALFLSRGADIVVLVQPLNFVCVACSVSQGSCISQVAASLHALVMLMWARFDSQVTSDWAECNLDCRTFTS
jgi:hypothetical protein